MSGTTVGVRLPYHEPQSYVASSSTEEKYTVYVFLRCTYTWRLSKHPTYRDSSRHGVSGANGVGHSQAAQVFQDSSVDPDDDSDISEDEVRGSGCVCHVHCCQLHVTELIY